MIGFDEAIDRLAGLGKPLGSERVSLGDAHGRILAEPVIAAIAAPRRDVSSMDGYAVRTADVEATPSRLPIVGYSYPGQPFSGDLPERSCVRLFTGAAVPAGADRVIVQEEVREEEGVALFGAVSPSRFIRFAASDFAAGDVLLPAGTRMSPGALLAAGGGDVAELTVWRRPRVGLLVTGDELVDPGTAHTTSDAIPDSVSLAVISLTSEWGGAVSAVRRLPDDLARSSEAAREMASEVDLIVVTGGASVGSRDFAKAMFEPLGLELAFSKVSMKPGKPVWAGRAGKCLLLGLPGNPTSALVTARLFLAPLLAILSGRRIGDALAFWTMPLRDAVCRWAFGRLSFAVLS